MNDKSTLFTAIINMELINERIDRYVAEFQCFDYQELKHILGKYNVIREMQEGIIRTLKIRIDRNIMINAIRMKRP